MRLPARPKRGFTLIELIVTLLILAILAGLAIVGYSTITARAQRTAALANLRQIADAVVAEHTAQDASQLSRTLFLQALEDASTPVDASGWSAASGWTFFGPDHVPTAQQFSVAFDTGDGTAVSAQSGTRAVVMTQADGILYARVIVYGQAAGSSQDLVDGEVGTVPADTTPSSVLDDPGTLTEVASGSADTGSGSGTGNGTGGSGSGSGAATPADETMGVLNGRLELSYSEGWTDEDTGEVYPSHWYADWGRYSSQLADDTASSDTLTCTSAQVATAQITEDNGFHYWYSATVSDDSPVQVTCTASIHDTHGAVIARYTRTLTPTNSYLPVDTRADNGPAPVITSVSTDGSHVSIQPVIGVNTLYARFFQNGSEVYAAMVTVDPRTSVTTLSDPYFPGLPAGTYQVQVDAWYTHIAPLGLYKSSDPVSSAQVTAVIG